MTNEGIFAEIVFGCGLAHILYVVYTFAMDLRQLKKKERQYEKHRQDTLRQVKMFEMVVSLIKNEKV